jgi:putative FmdB family regulatory protein
VPTYSFRCRECGYEWDELARLGDTANRRCPECSAPARQRFGRVAVRYSGWGFTATDRLVSDPRGKDLKALRERAEEISDG